MGRTLMVFVALLTSACSSKYFFAPPPYNYETWVRPGTEDVTIMKDLLECNYASPLGGGASFEGGSRTLNELVGSMICMERLGYSYVEERKVQHVCQMRSWNRVGEAACLDGKDVPVPDPQRRLSSGYCKKYPKSDACLP